MMQKYEKMYILCLFSEEESLLLKRILETVENINNRYVAHSADMEGLVVSVETSSREYEETMEVSLNDMSTFRSIQTSKSSEEWQKTSKYRPTRNS